MEKINGISFEDWAAGCGQLTHGMPEEDVIKTLGVELPVWQDTMEKFTEKLSDPDLIMKYTEIFSNPNVGPFANAGGATGEEEWRKVIPDHGAFIRLQREMGIATQNGVDAAQFLEEKGLNVGQYSQASMAFMQMQNEMDSEDVYKAYKENSSDLDQKELMEKYFPEYDQYIALLFALDVAEHQAMEQDRFKLQSTALHARRDKLTELGVDQNLYSYMVEHYNAWEQEQLEKQGEDAFNTYRNGIIDNVRAGNVSVPNVIELENKKDSLTDDIEF
ncbi:hypothetical protein MG290_09845 [Flavobacterium sp. CBA20B-1]|uniref:DUF6620 family protein n=1 Tax=unclassified Flavobacterium TaxID=196869 RepID=UPI0022243388|nr:MULTISPECIES: DUF6620 family protein [unclassified Flavobacterium]WCM41259.1 hypothetical protein MG290_09845 [Flavobacterium sp. CBA20B-1]